MRILLVLIGFLLSTAIYSQGQCPSIKWSKIYNAHPRTNHIENDGNDKFFVTVYNPHANKNFRSGSLQISNADHFIACIDTTGKWLWHTITDYNKLWGLNFNQSTQTLYAVATIDQSRIYGNDTIIVDPGDSKLILSALTPGGNFLWTKSLRVNNSQISWWQSTGAQLDSDQAGNIYLSVSDTIQVDSVIVPNGIVKLDQNGQYRWHLSLNNFSNAAYQSTYGASISTMKSGKNWVNFSFGDSVQVDQQMFYGYREIFGMIDHDGSWLWFRKDSTHTFLLSNGNGFCYTSGRYRSHDYLSRVDSMGNTIWSMPDYSTLSTYRISADSDAAGNLYYTERYSSSATLNFGNDSIQVNDHGSYIFKIDRFGKHKWAGYMPGLPNDGIGSYLNNSLSYLDDRNILSYKRSAPTYGMDSVPGPYRLRSALINFSNYGQAKIEVRADTTINCGDSIELGTFTNSAAQLYYQWSPTTGMKDSTSHAPVVTPATTTTYTVRAMRPGGCMDSASVTIKVDPKPSNFPKLNYTGSTGDLTYCDSNYSVSAPSGFDSYLWESGDTTRSFSPPGPGTYNITVTSRFGCQIKDSVVIEPLAKVLQGPHQYLCSNFNDSVRLSAVTPPPFDSIVWNTGETTYEIYTDQPGTYWFTLWKNGCVWSDTTLVEYFSDTANADFSYSPIGFHGKQIQFKAHSDGINLVSWSFGDGYNDNVINPKHIYNSYGSYTVCLSIRDICGYRDTVCKEITVQEPVSIEEAPIKAIQIYPNPAEDKITIESNAPLSTDPRTRLQLFDIRGRVVRQQALIPGTTALELETVDLKKGLYFLQIGDKVFKLVKE